MIKKIFSTLQLGQLSLTETHNLTMQFPIAVWMNFISSLLLTSDRRKCDIIQIHMEHTFVMQEREFFIVFGYSHFKVHSYVSRYFIGFYRDWQFTSDSSIAFIAMGTTYFNQTEGFSLSLSIYYLFATPNISVFNFPYICLWFPYPFAWAVFWVSSLEMILWQEINITILRNLEET